MMKKKNLEMNKRGQMFMFTLMMAAVIVILALALSPVVNDFVQDARNSTVGDTLGMDCNNSSISDFTAAACTTTDLIPFAFLGVVVAFAGALIGAKLITGG